MKRRRKSKASQQIKVGHGHVTYSGYGVHADKKRRALDRIRREESNQNPRRRRLRNPHEYIVRDPWSGHTEEFSTIKSAVAFAKRNGLTEFEMAENMFVEMDETLVRLVDMEDPRYARVAEKRAMRNPSKGSIISDLADAYEVSTRAANALARKYGYRSLDDALDALQRVRPRRKTSRRGRRRAS